jgi:hypothetical protein
MPGISVVPGWESAHGGRRKQNKGQYLGLARELTRRSDDRSEQPVGGTYGGYQSP